MVCCNVFYVSLLPFQIDDLLNPFHCNKAYFLLYKKKFKRVRYLFSVTNLHTRNTWTIWRVNLKRELSKLCQYKRFDLFNTWPNVSGYLWLNKFRFSCKFLRDHGQNTATCGLLLYCLYVLFGALQLLTLVPIDFHCVYTIMREFSFLLKLFLLLFLILNLQKMLLRIQGIGQKMRIMRPMQKQTPSKHPTNTIRWIWTWNTISVRSGNNKAKNWHMCKTVERWNIFCIFEPFPAVTVWFWQKISTFLTNLETFLRTIVNSHTVLYTIQYTNSILHWTQ